MKFKRFVLLAICLILCVTSIPTYVLATETSTSSGENTFVPMPKEEYEYYVSILKHGTNEEKNSVVNAIYEYANSNMSTYAWSSQYSQNMGDGTYLIQGFVTCSHSKNGMVVRTTVPASMRGSGSAGYTWTGYDSGYSAAGNGNYSYEGDVSVSILEPTKLYIAVYGTFEIAESVAIGMGIDFDIFNNSYTWSGTTYYRTDFQGSHIEVSPVMG